MRLRDIIIPATFGFVALACTAPDARAQSSASTVVEFFQNKSKFSALRQSTSEADRAAVTVRHSLDKALHLGAVSELGDVHSDLLDEVRRIHPQLTAVHEAARTSFVDGELDRVAFKERLLNLPHSTDWYGNTVANDALATLYMRDREMLLAARYAQAALDQIPEETSFLVSDAQLMVANRTTAMFVISGDPAGMMDSVLSVRRIQGDLGVGFNRHEAMTNFLLAFNLRRDHAGAATIAELLEVEPRPEGTAAGVAEVYTSDLLNELGRHREALLKALEARNAGDPFVQRRSHGEAMIAYAGLGQRSNALAEMRTLGFWDSRGPTAAAEQSEAALHARALLAASSGDSAQAVALMNQRLDLMVRQLREANAKDSASLLAHLENSRERQVERERALEKQARDAAVIAQQKTRLSRYLMALVVLVSSGLVALLVFLRYRERINAERIGLQAQALSAEKMKTEFLGVINHELRTPLNGVIGISDALVHHNPDPTVRQQAQAILDSGELLQGLIESMIDMTTLEGGKMELVADEVVLSGLFEREAARWTRAADAKGLTYTQFIAPALDTPVCADAKRAVQCLSVLLANAMRFTHQGRVHLHVTAAEADGHLALSAIVADTGQGISEDVQSRLFKPFLQADSTMTRKYGGAGLSLAIARKLARMMGGDVVVTSAQGRGSEFTYTARLPLALAAPAQAPVTAAADGADPVADTADTADAPAEAVPVLDLIDIVPEIFAPEPQHVSKPAPAALPRTDLRGRRILVVEDLPSNQDVIRLMLEAQGCTCVPALSGEEALEHIRVSHFDAVLMDVRMPGMDGLETVRRLRAGGALMPVVMLTADADAQTNIQAMEAGADLFLTKPVVARTLVDTLRRALGAPDVRRSA